MTRFEIEVRFERERINTLTADGEVLLTLLASFAAEESNSLSQNVKWTFQKKFREGRPHSKQRMLGYRWVGDEKVVVEEEADAVRFIFNSYISGMGPEEIARKLNEKGVKTLRGKKKCGTPTLHHDDLRRAFESVLATLGKEKDEIVKNLRLPLLCMLGTLFFSLSRGWRLEWRGRRGR